MLFTEDKKQNGDAQIYLYTLYLYIAARNYILNMYIVWSPSHAPSIYDVCVLVYQKTFKKSSCALLLTIRLNLCVSPLT